MTLNSGGLTNNTIEVLNTIQKDGMSLNDRHVISIGKFVSILENTFDKRVDTVQMLRECYPVLSLTKIDGLMNIVIDASYNPDKDIEDKLLNS